MSLTEKIAADLITAMKAKDKVSLEAIRAAKTAFLLAHSEKGSDSVLTAEEEIKIIQRLVKQRRESAQIYKDNSRPDLYEKETTKSPSDLGRVMGQAMKELAGKADGKEISSKVKQLLG